MSSLIVHFLKFSGTLHETCGDEIRFFATFNEANRVDPFVPLKAYAIHFETPFKHIRWRELCFYGVTQPSDSQPGEHHVAGPARPALSIVLIKVPVAIAAFLNFESDGKTLHGLAAQMRDGYLRRINNGKARLPNSKAQIDFLEIIEELFVETSQSSEEFTAEQYAASRLPVNCPLRIAFPCRISVGGEYVRKMGKGSQTKC